MRRLVLIASAAALGVLAPSAVGAQETPSADPSAAPSARQLGLRYLEWPGKAVRPPASAAVVSPPAPTAPQPQPAPMAAAAAPSPAYGRLAPSPYQPQARGLTAAAMMPIGPADPRAPRRDAPIFNMAPGDQTTPPPAAPPPPVRMATAATPSPRPTPAPTPVRQADDARYYSVHRMAGREPDPIPLPAPFFLDAAPVDLAEPPPPPTIVRNGSGAVAPAVELDLP